MKLMGAWGLVLVISFSSGALLGTHKHKISSEGSPQLWSWADSCSIRDGLFERSFPIEDEFLEPRDGCSYCDSQVGASLLRIHTNWQQPNWG